MESGGEWRRAETHWRDPSAGGPWGRKECRATLGDSFGGKNATKVTKKRGWKLGAGGGYKEDGKDIIDLKTAVLPGRVNAGRGCAREKPFEDF